MPHPFTVEDLYLHRKPGELEPHPDGRSIACTVRGILRDQDDYASCIWRVDLQGGQPRQLTRGPGGYNRHRSGPVVVSWRSVTL